MDVTLTVEIGNEHRCLRRTRTERWGRVPVEGETVAFEVPNHPHPMNFRVGDALFVSGKWPVIKVFLHDCSEEVVQALHDIGFKDVQPR